MRVYLFGCLLALATLSGQSCVPQPQNTGNNTGDTTDDGGTDPDNNNTGGTDNGGNTNTDTGTDTDTGHDVGPQPTQDEHVLGASSAKVTVIEYADFQCPFCGAFTRDTFPTIKQEYIQTGKVKWIFRHFPLRSIHPYAEKAAQASECANNQGSFWAYTDLVFEKQDELDGLIGGNNDITAVVARLKEFASDLSLSRSTFDTCLDSDSEADRVQRDVDSGTLDGACQSAANQNNPDCVLGTPTFFVNGERHTFRTNDSVGEMRGWLDAALDTAQ